jgi:hypothetical protein
MMPEGLVICPYSHLGTPHRDRLPRMTQVTLVFLFLNVKFRSGCGAAELSSEFMTLAWCAADVV